MTCTRCVALLIAALGISLQAFPQGREIEPRPMRDRSWSVAVRVGGFTDRSDGSWFGRHLKVWRHDTGPAVASGLDVSRLLGPRSGLTLSFDGMVFGGDAAIIAPVSLSYKYYPIGNGTGLAAGRRSPSVQPWLGVGGGVYAFIADDDRVVSSHPGAHASAGLLVPISRRLDVVGELRYAAAKDARVLSYTMGLGVRF